MQQNINFEQNLMKDLLYQHLNEKKISRRWGIFFKLLLISFIIMIFIITTNTKQNKNKNHIAIIEINDEITAKSKTNSKNIINIINEAFNNKNCKAIIIKINSPGGAPVQSNIIHNHIKKIRNSNINKPIFSVIEDIGTSGAYLIALATEKIYCDPTSIIGSIGVVINSFGFVDTLNKLGIERRLYKSAEFKALMDPFSDKKESEDKIIQHNINLIHEHFVNIVKKNRYNNTKNYNIDIFSGKFWLGIDALEIGLIDGFYDIYTLASDIFKLNTLVYYDINSNIFNILEKKINILTKN